MATLGGSNTGKYRGKYSGSAGKNYGRNPQPGFGGGGGGGGKKGCPLFLLQVAAVVTPLFVGVGVLVAELT